MTEETCTIQVIARLRPLSEKEKSGAGAFPVVTASTEKKEISVVRGTGSRQCRSSFVFDKVFGSFSTQDEVFRELAPMVDQVLGGYEATVFAYGQTGTGKTYTMEGDISSETESGVIPRSAQAIFHQLSQPKYAESAVTASYLEIYNEELCDLLALPGSEGDAKLNIVEDKRPRGKGIYCQNLSEQSVKSPADVLSLMQRAQERRRVGETKMNKQSSRSHCLFTLSVTSKLVLDDGSIMECAGKLHMVDLAGSECAKTAGGPGQDASRERERKNINQSLLTLGRVITALRSGGAAQQRIPYRDSKLTRLLQESLGGRCKTVIIATLSPSVLAAEETLSTLTYAQQAHGIENKPVATSLLKLTRNPMAVSMEKMTEGGAGASAQDWTELECRLLYMETQVEEAQAALARKHREQQEYIDRANQAETERDATAADLRKTRSQLEESEIARRDMERVVLEVKEQLHRREMILAAHQKTEVSLRNEGSALLDFLRRSIADGDNLYSKLVQHAEEERVKREQTQRVSEQCTDAVQQLQSHIGTFNTQLGKSHDVLVKSIHDARSVSEQALASLESQIVAAAAASEKASGSFLKIAETRANESNTDLTQTTSRHTELASQIREIIKSAVENTINKGLSGLIAVVEAGDTELMEWGTHTVSTLEAVSGQVSKMSETAVVEVKAHSEWTEQQLLSARDALTENKEATARLASALTSISAQLDETRSQTHTLASDVCTAAQKQVAELGVQKAELEKTVEEHVAGRKGEAIKGVLAELATGVIQAQDDHNELLETQVAALKTQSSALVAQEGELKAFEATQRKEMEESFARMMQTLEKQMHSEFQRLTSTMAAQVQQQVGHTKSVLEGVHGAVATAEQLEKRLLQTSENVIGLKEGVQELAEQWEQADSECDAAILGSISTTNQVVTGSLQEMVSSTQSASALLESRIKDISKLTSTESNAATNLGSDLLKQHADLAHMAKTANAKFATAVSKADEVTRIATSAFSAQKVTVEAAVDSRVPVLRSIQEKTSEIGTFLKASEKSALETVAKAEQATTSSAQVQRNIWSGLGSAQMQQQAEIKSQMDSTLATVGEVRQQAVELRVETDEKTIGDLSEIRSALSETVSWHEEATSTLRNEIHLFANDVINAYEEVVSPADRAAFPYSSTLTVTPPEEEILRSQGVDPVSPTSALNLTGEFTADDELTDSTPAAISVAQAPTTTTATRPATAPSIRSKVAAPSTLGLKTKIPTSATTGLRTKAPLKEVN